MFSRPRGPSPVQQPNLVRRQQGDARRAPALVPRDVRPAVCRIALLQCVRAAHGHARQVHGGAGALDRPHCPGPAAADPRRRPSDDGLRLHRRCREGQRAGAAVGRLRRRRDQRRERSRDLAARAGGGAAEGDGATHLVPEYGPERSVNPVLRRLASTRRRSRCWASAPRSASRRGSIASCAGGRKTGLWRSRHERLRRAASSRLGQRADRARARHGDCRSLQLRSPCCSRLAAATTRRPPKPIRRARQPPPPRPKRARQAPTPRSPARWRGGAAHASASASPRSRPRPTASPVRARTGGSACSTRRHSARAAC